jgi:predicted nucleotidyltransferase
MLHVTVSRRGGRARSSAKTAANRAKIIKYWKAVRAGRLPAPYRPRTPPADEAIARLLTSLCRESGITCLEVFGSVARGEARRGSDVDLIATFREHPGLRIVEIEDRMAALLGVSVDLLTGEGIDEMTNPFRKESILRDRRTIYVG